ncbi:hypothetical protein PFICI_09804 [Pestalotiopsis fici W106-1]|uniref:Uncharacterized protein n=1 Tax=Pestalotiopsis fici (strain W106-1 / CGMCC3.15140) TaxID=1229662 RepID=W3WXB8_PESFW|nr:uncharacterized protein PFICI_09804 [Pestalotiopsis fici W106-1]ETS77742.1 hypothetical protein PFICI_09804 [Pestalotiopsis fici W106-1]
MSSWNFPKPLNKSYQGRTGCCEGIASAPNERNSPPSQQVQSRGRIRNWMKASDESNQQAAENSDNGALYRNGIDAHSGPHSLVYICGATSGRPMLENASTAGMSRGSWSVDEGETCATSTYPHHHRRCSETDAIDPLLHELRRYSFMPLKDQTPECLRRMEQHQEPLDRLEELQLRDQSNTSSKTTLEDILDRFIFTGTPSSRTHAGTGGYTASK